MPKKLEEWVESIRHFNETSSYKNPFYEDLYKALNIIEHLVGALNLYSDSNYWGTEGFLYENYGDSFFDMELAQQALEAAKKEIE